MSKRWLVGFGLALLLITVVTVSHVAYADHVMPHSEMVGENLIEILPDGHSACYTVPLCNNGGCGQVSPPVCYYVATAVAPTPQYYEYAVPLPSGVVGKVSMHMTAGDIAIVVAISALLLWLSFDVIGKAIRRVH